MGKVVLGRVLGVFLSICMISGICLIPGSIGITTVVRAEESNENSAPSATQEVVQSEPEESAPEASSDAGPQVTAPEASIDAGSLETGEANGAMDSGDEVFSETQDSDIFMKETMSKGYMPSLDEEGNGCTIQNMADLVTALGAENVSVVSDTEIKLIKDINFSGSSVYQLCFAYLTVTIDFNGHTCSGAVSFYIFSGNVTFVDNSTSGNGGIIADGIVGEKINLDYAIWIGGGFVTVKSGHYSALNAVISAESGAMVIEGGSFTGVGLELEDGRFPSGSAVRVEPTITVAEIRGGNFEADFCAIICTKDTYEDVNASIPSSLQISGGVFQCKYQGAIKYIDIASDQIPDMMGDIIVKDCMLVPPTVYQEVVYDEDSGSLSHSISITEDRVQVCKTTGVEGFVYRLYDKVLKRTPDFQGYSSWVTQLISKQISGTDVAYGFFFSPEVIYQYMSNEDYVTLLYNAFLNRAPDKAGMANWLFALEAGASRHSVFAGFANSQEWKSLCGTYAIEPGSYTSDDPRDQNPKVTAFVQRLYMLCLERPADEAGLVSWTYELNSKSQDGAHVAYGFFFSPEFKNRNLSNEDYVDVLYKVLLGRDSDPAGKADWVAQLKAGKDRLEIFRGFVHSQEFDAICADYGIVRGTI